MNSTSEMQSLTRKNTGASHNHTTISTSSPEQSKEAKTKVINFTTDTIVPVNNEVSYNGI